MKTSRFRTATRYYAVMRIAMAQINPTVGNISGNVERIVDFASRAKAQNAQVVVFPELATIGYPPKDLLLKPKVIDDNITALGDIAKRTVGIDVLLGFAAKNVDPAGRELRNAIALLRGGKIESVSYKTLLPTYDVFDEGRYFESGSNPDGQPIVEIAGQKAGLSICEDLWNDEQFFKRPLYRGHPIADLAKTGAEVLFNISASPFVLDKQEFRVKLFGGQAKRYGKPLISVNQVGGNDELVFDGNSIAFDGQGRIIALAKDFEEDLVVFDLDSGPIDNPEFFTGVESIYHALILGLRDYMRKCGFKSVVLGLSGGIDSALTAAIAVDALGPEKVVGVAMPSRYSSEHSVGDAADLARNLGIKMHTVPIKGIHDAYESALAQVFAGTAEGLAEENLQARIRGALLMAVSNKFDHLLLTTGNKSELAVGYCTLYGDMCGGLALISDVPKTTVWELSRWINAKHGRERIPRNSIEKAPSAELKPNQTDQDSLPPYPLLDAIIHRYVEEEKSANQIVAEGYDRDTVLRIIKLIDRSEYKRRQAAPGLKVTSRAFGFGRRMPMAQGYQHLVI